MKQLAKLMLIMVVALWAAPIIAQTPTTQQTTYTVAKGDNGWNLARQYYNDATTWQRIVDMNPFLQERGRVIQKDGKIILILKPGEQLVGLERLNVTPPTAVSIEEILPTTPAATQLVKAENIGLNLMTLLIVIGILALIAGGVVFISQHLSRVRREREVAERERQTAEATAAREHELNQNPVTSGRPYVPGGIPATEPQRLQDFFTQQAVARYAERNPTIDRTTIRVEQVGPIEDGTIAGEGEVGYLGGTWRPRRINTPINAYQGRFRYQDGTEELLQCLVGCMNPVRFGGEVMRGFTFTARRVVVPVPEPVQPALAPAQHPAMAVRRIREAAQAEGHNTITIDGQVMEFLQGYHIVVDRQTGTMKLEAAAFEMTLTPKKIKAALAVREEQAG